MPLYEFVCTDKKCKEKFESLVPMGTETKACPKCTKPAPRVTSTGQRFLFNYMAEE